MTKLDMGPVIDLLVRRGSRSHEVNGQMLVTSPERDAYGVIGEILGMNWDSVKARRHRGTGFTEAEADKIATELGYHPSDLWPDFGKVDINAGKRLCANPKCGGWFFPRRAFQKWCHRNCGARYRWSHEVSSPDYTPQKRKPAERTESRLAYERVQRRLYYARNREAERERQRRYYQANREKEQARKAAERKAA